jgi:hypothetical protein
MSGATDRLPAQPGTKCAAQGGKSGRQPENQNAHLLARQAPDRSLTTRWQTQARLGGANLSGSKLDGPVCRVSGVKTEFARAHYGGLLGCGGFDSGSLRAE